MHVITPPTLNVTLIRTAMAWDGTLLALQPVHGSLLGAILEASHFERMGMICLIVYTAIETFHMGRTLWRWVLARYRAWRRSTRAKPASEGPSPPDSGHTVPVVGKDPPKPARRRTAQRQKATAQ